MDRFELGDKVEHILTNTWFLVIELKPINYICRSKDMSVVEFKPFEIRKV